VIVIAIRIVFGLIGVIDTAEAKIGDSKSNIFEFQPICKKAFNTCVSGA
jgi:hypothetical protein